jgi:hypothetical protein
MKISLALEIINKIDKINNFFLLVELKFQENETGLQKVKYIQKIIRDILINLVVDFDQKLSGETSKNKFTTIKIYDEFEKIMKVLADRFIAKKMENYHLLERDLLGIIAISRNQEYLPKSSLNLSVADANEDDIKKLKEKILLIKSENFA